MVSETYFANSRKEREQMEDSYGDRRYDIYGRRKPVQETGTIQNCIVMQEMAAVQQKSLYNLDKSENKEQKKPQNEEKWSLNMETGEIKLIEIILKEEVY